MIALLLACAAPDTTLALPALPPEVNPPPLACPLTVTPHDLGGVWGAAAVGEGWAAAASAERIVRSDGVSARLPGQVRQLHASGDTLWAALGSGIGRIDADGAVTVWSTGGEVRSVTTGPERAWAADRTGRLLSLPLTATAEDTPTAAPIDGFPHTLAQTPDGVVLRTSDSHLIAVDSLTRLSQDADSLAGPARAEGRLITLHGHTLDVESRINALSWQDDRLWIAATDRLLVWDGDSEPVHLDPLTDSAVFHGSALTGDGGRLAVAGGEAGAWLEDEQTTTLPGGRATSMLVQRDGGVVLGGPSALWLLDDTLTLTGSIPLPAPAAALAEDDRGLLVAAGGLHRLVDGALTLITDTPGDLSDLAVIDGTVFALSPTDGLHRLVDGVLQPDRPPTTPASQRLGAWGTEPLTGGGFLGRLHTASATHSLPAPLFSLIAWRSGTMRTDGDDLLIALPDGGLHRLTPEGTRTALLPPPAWDVLPWAGGLAVAAGIDGVTLSDGTRCPLPGAIHRLARHGPDLLALSDGVLYRLTKP